MPDTQRDLGPGRGDLRDGAAGQRVLYLVPDQIELVVEVTSPSNADNDRRPQRERAKTTKWSGYARAEIPYYLLIDRDPRVARITLYSIPDQGTGAYLHQEVWEFGHQVRLPEPFGIEIATEAWSRWACGRRRRRDQSRPTRSAACAQASSSPRGS
jgi:hypothetical protein